VTDVIRPLLPLDFETQRVLGRDAANREREDLADRIAAALAEAGIGPVDPYDNHDRRILEDADSGGSDAEIVVVRCPHRIGLCYRGAPAPDMESDWLMRLPCPCNDRSEVVAVVVAGVGPVAEAEPTDPQWVFSEEAAARLIASVAWPFERRENRESWAPRLLAEPEMLEQEYRSAVARLRSAYAKCFVAAARAAAEQTGGTSG
jgi:hypothetical protein